MDEEVTIRNDCLDSAKRLGLFPIDIRKSDSRTQWKWRVEMNYDIDRLVKSEIALAASSQPMDIDPPVQPDKLRSDSVLLATQQCGLSTGSFTNDCHVPQRHDPSS